MQIGSRKIGIDAPPFIIAEMSGNHNQSLDRALAIVEAAAKSGAHALKLQTFKPETITLDVREGDFFVNDEKSLWKGNSLYDLYKKAYTPWEWHAPLMKRAAELGMLCFSTPFDFEAVDFLESLDVPCHKVASFENNHLPLIRKVAATGKPLLISTGMATLAELHEAVTTAREAGCKDIILLKCTSNYPSTPVNTNVLTIPHMRELFNVEVGLSDHTFGVGAAVAAIAHGASVVEKHFCLARAEGGVDSAFSLEPAEMASLVVETERAWQSLGGISYGPLESEKGSLVFRRSLYVAEDMKAGDTLTAQNLRIIRPGHGLHPRHYEQLLGRKIKTDVKRGTAMKWDLV